MKREARTSWSDSETVKLESILTFIAAEIVPAAEIQLREGAERIHQWRIERKAEIEEEDRRRLIERARQERERQERLEAARIASLLKTAEAFRTSQEIRAYVSAPGQALGPKSDRRTEYEDWSRWALAQADRIDQALAAPFSEPVEAETEEPDTPVIA